MFDIQVPNMQCKVLYYNGLKFLLPIITSRTCTLHCFFFYNFIIFVLPSKQKCRQCRQCRTKQTSHWHIDYTLCDKCYQYKHTTNRCPLCNEEQGNQKVIQCDSCSRWVLGVLTLPPCCNNSWPYLFYFSFWKDFKTIDRTGEYVFLVVYWTLLYTQQSVPFLIRQWRIRN